MRAVTATQVGVCASQLASGSRRHPPAEASCVLKRAIISDIHGNLEALQAVLADIRAQGVDDVFCLGDIIGYGPNPCECLDLIIENCRACLLGNHDQGALFDPEGFNTGAERAIFWTRQQLENSRSDRQTIDRRWDFLGALPRVHRDEPWLYVHGSVRNPVNEYVFPEDIYNQKKMEKLFSLVPSGCFQGHTHVPGVFTESRNFMTPEETDYAYSVNEQKFMINVGSVGQPRDGDPRPCYVIQEDRRIEFRRVDYDFGVTAEKIYGIPDLDNFLGDRIKQGR
jgi:predicted phosphodiesterase